MAKHEIIVNSWQNFIEVAERLNVGSIAEPAYVFRGQPRPVWSLMPTLPREAVELGLNSAQTLEIEQTAMELFKKQAHLWLDANTWAATNQTLEWWTLMQHHQAPTRMLDWSKSPYVAAYFAIEKSFDDDGTVWVLHAPTVRQTMKDRFGVEETLDEQQMSELLFDPNAPPLLWITERSTLTNRMVTQQGLFSFCAQILNDHAEVLRDLLDDAGGQESYSRIIIPAKLKREFLRRLTTINITASVLFPGVDGLGRSVAEYVRVAAYSQSKGAPGAGRA